MTRPAQERIDAYEYAGFVGEDAVVACIMAEGTLTFIAADVGVAVGTLLTWIEANPERSARVREARVATAKLWDEKAETRLNAATNPFELAKARELAFHYRWRATKIAPRDYGDKMQVDATVTTLEKLVEQSQQPAE